MPDSPPSSTSRIGVFDSGVGGLSVLRALRKVLPDAELLYVADSGHAPYGERTEAFVVQRSLAIAQFLATQGAQMMVVACNTATAAAVAALRAQHPDWPIVGVEPGLKPAVARTRNGRIGVMATTGTLRSDKFQRLMQTHGTGVTVHLQACPGLARAIEQGQLDSPALRDQVAGHCAPLREHGVDTVVLGCTHYPFAAPLIQSALGDQVVLIDTAEAVARRALDLARQLPVTAASHPGLTRMWSSGDPDQLRQFAAQWLGESDQVESLPASV
jgi:glutamate racemase